MMHDFHIKDRDKGFLVLAILGVKNRATRIPVQTPVIWDFIADDVFIESLPSGHKN